MRSWDWLNTLDILYVFWCVHPQESDHFLIDWLVDTHGKGNTKQASISFVDNANIKSNQSLGKEADPIIHLRHQIKHLFCDGWMSLLATWLASSYSIQFFPDLFDCSSSNSAWLKILKSGGSRLFFRLVSDLRKFTEPHAKCLLDCLGKVGF